MEFESINRDILKTVLIDLLKEGDPELQDAISMIVSQYFAAMAQSDRAQPLDMATVRERYAIPRDAFAPLQELFADAPPAHQIVEQLRK